MQLLVSDTVTLAIKLNPTYVCTLFHCLVQHTPITCVPSSTSAKNKPSSHTPFKHVPKAMYLSTETGLYCTTTVCMYVRTFTSAGKGPVKLDTFPRTLARQAVTGSVAYAKMSLQGERRCVTT